MAMKKTNSAWGQIFFIALIVTAVLVSGCPLRDEPEKVVSGPPPLDGPSLVEEIKDRNSQLHRLDARIKAALSGGNATYRGRFFGTILIEGREEKGVDMMLQVYNLAGVPVLEIVSQGPRVQVFSPLDNSVFVNFAELASGDKMDEFPLSSFNEVAMPLETLTEQIGLIMGTGFSDDYRYKLTEHDDYYRLTEWDGDIRRREMEFSRSGFALQEVRSYRGGILLGTMKCSEHFAGPGKSRVPSRVVLFQDDMKLKLDFSKLRFNSDAKGGEISFRAPGDARVILLTPPVP